MEHRIAASTRTKRWLTVGSLVALMVIALASSVVSADSTATRADMVVNHNPADVQAAWNNWRNQYVTSQSAGPAPRLRVMGGVSNTSTVSEGQAYGLLLASLFDEQTMFDGLWLFAADHLNQNGLMHWHIGPYGQIYGSGAATDADVDMGIAFITACEKVRDGQWPASSHGLNYCQIATTLINAMWMTEVDHPGTGPSAGLNNNPGYELLPGDSWVTSRDYPNGIVNLSYFSPGYFRVFAEFTGNAGWYDVIDRNYAIADLSQNLDGNCSKLVPNWSQYNGQVQVVPWHGATSAYFGWDGARFAWRVAIDRYWFDDPKARETMNEVGGFFASVGINNVRSEYRLNGTSVQWFAAPYFVSMAGAAIWAAPNPMTITCGDASGRIQSNPQQAYNAVLSTATENYYNDSWRLLTLVLMTGNFPNPLDGASNPPAPTGEPTEITPLPTEPTEQPAEPSPEPTEATPAPTEEPINTAPTIAPIQPVTHAAGDAVTLQIQASDADGDALRYDAGNTLPQGLAINTSTGLISGTINATISGEYPVTVRVIDARGAEATAAFSWTVTAQPSQNPAPVASTASVTIQGGQANNQQAQFRIRLQNTGDQPLSNLSVRFYFTPDNGQPASRYTLERYWDQSGAGTLSGPTQVSDTLYYFAVNFGSATLAAGQTWQYHGTLRTVDWSANMDRANDWWSTGITGQNAPTNFIPVYQNGSLIAGAEPGNTPPPVVTTPVEEPVAPVITPQPTQPQPTEVIITPQPSEAVITPEPAQQASSLGVRIVRSGTDNAQQVGFKYQLVNNGTNAQAGISVRLYFTVDNGQPAANYVLERYWDQSGSASISGPTSAGGDTYYFTVTYGGTLQPGQNWEFHTALRLSNWSQNFNSNNDWWKGGTLPSSFTNTNRIPIYVNGALVAGQTP